MNYPKLKSPMKADEKCIRDIFSNIKYKIPVYQRPYSWTTDEAILLYEDINDAIEQKIEEYFIGSIILIKDKDSKDIYEIVDGQQRITTISIMMSAIMKCLKDNSQKDHVKKYYMQFNPMRTGTDECRLKVRDSDAYFYRSLLNWEWDDCKNLYSKLSDSQKNMLENRDALYERFSKLTQQEIIEFEQYLEERVLMVSICTESWKSAYKLFNVLNARGMPLSNSDLIKNEILSKTTENQHDDIISIWEDIEEKIGISQLDDFFGHVRTAMGLRQQNTLQETFSIKIDENKKSMLNFMNSLSNYANSYVKIRKCDYSNSVRQHFISLDRVFYKDWISVLLAYYKCDKCEIDEKDFIILLEKITYQNWIRNLGRTKRIQVYYDLIMKINDGGNREDIYSVFKNHADNTELKQFLESNIYTRPYCKALLLKIEEELQDDSVHKKYNGTITIEHILPQTMTDKYWLDRFTEEIKESLVHKIGNLTLLSGRKNSAAQNYDFDRKKIYITMY
jgi:uncharacterized protein with ParB-like and HNH nuclease domain